MPGSFRFRGFTTAAVVALVLAQGPASVQAAVTWGQPGGGGQPNATFSISLIDGGTDVVAPYPAVFRAVGMTGFKNPDGTDCVEPAGDTNVYDPTQHRVTLIWDFDDPGYEFAKAPNILTAWRNLNVGYGKEVAHVWHTPGSYTVTCFAFDTAGNWGTATYTFGSGGQSPAIADPNTFAGFAGADTIVWSQSLTIGQVWPGAPAGATQCNTIEQVHNAARARIGVNRAHPNLRILMRAGETFTNNWFFNFADGNTLDTAGHGYPVGLGASAGVMFDYRGLKGCTFGSFGSGARPIIEYTQRQGRPAFSFAGGTGQRQLVLSGLDFRGGWDAAKEIGLIGDAGSIGATNGFVLLTRCRWSGFSNTPGDTLQPQRGVIYHDCEITNWANYGAFIGNTVRLAFLGCDIYQKPDALGGIGQIGRQEDYTLGNRHGGTRTGSSLYESVMSCCSFLSNTGWFPAGSSGGFTTNPSAEQPCVRQWSHFTPGGTNARRHYHVMERCTFEGGDVVVALGTTGGANMHEIEINAKNVLIDMCAFASGTRTFKGGIEIAVSGVTLRNCYFHRGTVQIAHPNTLTNEIDVKWFSNPALGQAGPIEIYNNTIFSSAPAFNTIRNFATFAASYNPITLAPGGNYLVQNNVVRIVNRSSPVDYRGEQFLPLGSSVIAGFTLRHQGARWNFLPVVITVGAARQNETGSASDWAPGTWVSIPYPDQTGQCGGIGQQLTQALVTGNSSQWHQVSVRGVRNNMTDLTLAPQSRGELTFNFTPTAIRIRNDSPVTFTQMSGQNFTEIWLLLDQSDRLMSPLPNTSRSGETVLALVPGAGSSAIIANKTPLWPRTDFTGQLRFQSLDFNGNPITSGSHVAGAFAAA